MTVFGWDASHFDGTLNRDHLVLARAEGIQFFTHKIGEGLSDTEGAHDDTALAAARDAGIPYLGGYPVPRSGASVAQQVDYWIRLADGGEPWWRQHPGWFWQIDLERWPYDAVPAAVGIAAAKLLRVQTGRWTILYASHGQYGDQLADWDGPLWNADYAATPAYPGDGWRPNHGGWTGGWSPYSGREPTFLQFTSSATIAGLTTCDANAYRGTLAELAALIGGSTMAFADEQLPAGAPPVGQSMSDLWNGWRNGHSGYTNPDGSHDIHYVNAQLNRIEAAAAASAARETALAAAVQALAAGGTSVDTAAIIAHVDQVAAAESATVAGLQAQIVALTAKLAAAGHALDA